MKKEPEKEHDLVKAAREMLAHERGEITLNSRIVSTNPEFVEETLAKISE